MILKSEFDQVVFIDCKLEESGKLSIGLLYIESSQSKTVEVTDGKVSFLVTLPDESVNTFTPTVGINRILECQTLNPKSL